MATLLQLEAQGHVSKVDPALPLHQQELRVLYASPRLRQWLENVLPTLGSTWNIELSPAEQLDALVEQYAAGEPLVYQHNSYPIRHVSGYVWELKTPDLRIFGWFHKMDCFVGVVANPTELIKRHNLYHGHAGDVVRFVDALDLDPPKFIAGDDPRVVVSNFYYP